MNEAQHWANQGANNGEPGECAQPVIERYSNTSRYCHLNADLTDLPDSGQCGHFFFGRLLHPASLFIAVVTGCRFLHFQRLSSLH